MKLWSCQVGTFDDIVVPRGADFPMRLAVEAEFRRVTKKTPDFMFSGWDKEKLPEKYLAALETRLPDLDTQINEVLDQLAVLLAERSARQHAN